MSIAPATVTIYNSEGKPETHTRQNARDLVTLAGYSWMPHIKAQPNHPSIYAGRTPPKGKTPAQEVLDRATGDDAKVAVDADTELDAEIAEQARQLAEMKAAAAASLAPAEAPVDFTAPVEEEVDPALQAILDGDGEEANDETASDEPALQPTARGRKRVGRSA